MTYGTRCPEKKTLDTTFRNSWVESAKHRGDAESETEPDNEKDRLKLVHRVSLLVEAETTVTPSAASTAACTFKAS